MGGGAAKKCFERVAQRFSLRPGRPACVGRDSLVWCTRADQLHSQVPAAALELLDLATQHGAVDAKAAQELRALAVANARRLSRAERERALTVDARLAKKYGGSDGDGASTKVKNESSRSGSRLTVLQMREALHDTHGSLLATRQRLRTLGVFCAVVCLLAAALFGMVFFANELTSPNVRASQPVASGEGEGADQVLDSAMPLTSHCSSVSSSHCEEHAVSTAVTSRSFDLTPGADPAALAEVEHVTLTRGDGSVAHIKVAGFSIDAQRAVLTMRGALGETLVVDHTATVLNGEPVLFDETALAEYEPAMELVEQDEAAVLAGVDNVGNATSGGEGDASARHLLVWGRIKKIKKAAKSAVKKAAETTTAVVTPAATATRRVASTAAASASRAASAAAAAAVDAADIVMEVGDQALGVPPFAALGQMACSDRVVEARRKVVDFLPDSIDADAAEQWLATKVQSIFVSHSPGERTSPALGVGGAATLGGLTVSSGDFIPLTLDEELATGCSYQVCSGVELSAASIGASLQVGYKWDSGCTLSVALTTVFETVTPSLTFVFDTNGNRMGYGIALGVGLGVSSPVNIGLSSCVAGPEPWNFGYMHRLGAAASAAMQAPQCANMALGAFKSLIPDCQAGDRAGCLRALAQVNTAGGGGAQLLRKLFCEANIVTGPSENDPTLCQVPDLIELASDFFDGI